MFDEFVICTLNFFRLQQAQKKSKSVGGTQKNQDQRKRHAQAQRQYIARKRYEMMTNIQLVKFHS